ncbi:MAG: DMT family transporter [Comamonadaceae bacterium]|nr:MAG: DMT family transporter [Comamonadaceae bacterium]
MSLTPALTGYLLAGAALLCFTTAILVTRAASDRVSLSVGFLVATATNVVFSALALGLQLVLNPAPIAWHGKAFTLFALAGAFSTYLGRWFFYESVVRFGAARASIFQVSSPLFTALMAWVVMGEKISVQACIGMGLTVGGLMLVGMKPGGVANAVRPASKGAPGGVIQAALASVFVLGLAGSMAYATGNVLRGAAVREWNEPILGGLVGAGCGLLLHLAFNRAGKGVLATLRAADRRGLGLFGVLGVCTISGQILTIAAMRYIPLSIATLITLFTPLLVFPLSRWLLKAHADFSAIMLAGSVLAMTGIMLVVLR